MVVTRSSPASFQRIYALSGSVRREQAAAASSGPISRGHYYSALRLHPEADNIARGLGLRFQAPGREVTTLSGTLSISGQQHLVRLIRTQNDDGEQMAVGLGGPAATLTWDYSYCPLTGHSPAAGGHGPLPA